MELKTPLKTQIYLACRRAFNMMDLDPLSQTKGCFDRRYWAWKLTDFPEATYQRLLYPLCWFAETQDEVEDKSRIIEAIKQGLLYTFSIQHSDGSFDQAYPFERSYGATAFLLNPLLQTYKYIKEIFNESEVDLIESGIHKAAEFLISHREGHGFISNHLAGSALALLEAGLTFQKDDWLGESRRLTQEIIQNQSDEGWYLEYSGADPGYQTLCTQYLAQIQNISPSKTLEDSLRNSVRFLVNFAHPDGSFAGEYGSRRTAIYYPGGIVSLADIDEAAYCLHRFMLESIERGNTVGVLDIDLGNLAPLLEGSIYALSENGQGDDPDQLIPFQQDTFQSDFKECGIFIRGNQSYYAILSTGNGGVFKVFDKQNKKLVYDRSAVVLERKNKAAITTQQTRLKNKVDLEDMKICFQSDLYRINRTIQSPGKQLILRVLNFTFMRWRPLNEFIKRLLSRFLILHAKREKISQQVSIEYLQDRILIKQKISGIQHSELISASVLSATTSIHMASARYPLSLSSIGKIQEQDYHTIDEGITWEEIILI